VKNPRAEIEHATQVGLERKREGYSPEALVLAVDEIVHDLPLARAIVVYVQSASDYERSAPIERPFAWVTVGASGGFAALCGWLAVLLLRQVSPAIDVWNVILIVLGQALLLRFAWAGGRLAVMSFCDGLNDSSYPTNLHPLRRASSIVGSLRLRRLRALVLETADRIVGGGKPAHLADELSEINLTPHAAKFAVRLARVNAAVRDFLPPYEPRWLAYTVAFAFVITAVICVQRVSNRIAEGYQDYAICLACWIAGDLAAGPRRRF